MSEKDKTKSPSKITLKRKTHTELKVETAPGQARTVPVEVRRKRTYVKQKMEDNVVTPEALDLSVAAEEIAADVPAVAQETDNTEDLPVGTTEPQVEPIEKEVKASVNTEKAEMEAKRKAEQEAKRLET
ncbi:MAG TPA: IF-2-associated domain-containing protein, partial [Candidatus Ignatzschineria merdigallinarum]|nr:IF-2-associated domain-containing protein [Candidatus Ignatzschineria merdigallinarum]